DELLKTAAARTNDPQLMQMSAWLEQYRQQREGFTAERRKQYEKAIAEIKKLEAGGKDDFAIDRAREAFVLADDKDAFHREIWVDALIKKTANLARNYENSEQWFKALRLYSDLAAIEPANAGWKDKLKLTTRRIRLLAVYTPDDFKALTESEAKEREAADALLREPGTTQPTTKPSEENDAFKTDWHDNLRGVRMEMLLDALDDARSNYWRDVDYRMLVQGGLRGLQSLVTTRGLERAFPALGDEVARNSFKSVIDQGMDAISTAKPDEQQYVLRKTLANVRAVNKQTVQLPEEVIVAEFADGAFGELDPFTGMIWPSDLDEFNKSTQGEFGGVGIQIQNDEDLNLKVVSPLEDSPAYRLGIKAGDIITRINGKNAKGITTTQAVKVITGPKGTPVTLTIRSLDGNEKDYTITREIIKVASVKGFRRQPGGSWDYFVDPEQRIAYIRLTNFTKTSEDELRKALDDVAGRGARALILDLRYNPGGLLTAATDVSDKFLRGGTIVSTRADRPNGAQPPVSLDAKPNPDDFELPMVVLVNQFSASASEIVSGALKDQHRATIVGERTFGKGSVQMLFALAGRTSYLKLTTSHYYLPSGQCIHREENATTWGVDPEVKVEMTPQQMTDAQTARQEFEVLRSATDNLPSGSQITTTPPTTGPSTAPTKKDLLAADPQLSAGLLVLRLQLTGASM
ncbi:MAG: S41 family peptidase, partial [Tepidisphaeraceae bacterium]